MKKILYKFGKWLCDKCCERDISWKCDIEDANIITDEKINFIYDNAVGYLKELESSMALLNTRVTLLLTYLASTIVFLINFSATKGNDSMRIGAVLIVLIYIVIICYTSICLILPRRKFTVNNEPKNLLKNEFRGYELKVIKFFECGNMQERINNNLEYHNRAYYAFKVAIFSTFLLPLVVIILLFFFLHR